ncbi:MAG: FKBP-type peptidyl-prolyl cis-trans isomerase [Pseudomonadales bacterium]|nr:FKBP-type peptidyl-prolyl cis-trans isomerase [Pseudomonadales bacterium]
MFKLIAILLTLFLFACSDESKYAAKDSAKESASTMDTSQDEKAMDLKDNLAAAAAFLEENAKKEDVIITESGLQYEVINSGDGKTPGLTDTVVTHYAGSFLDGSEFDSSISRGEPASFPVNGVIAGWTEALQLMQEGDKWRLFIPPSLAYGERGVGPIPSNAALIFQIELISVK